MMFHEFEVGNKTYKLRLNTRNVVMLERRLGCNPIAIFGNGETIPSITQMMHILHCSLLELQHNIGLEDAYAIYDAWLADGHNMTEFINEILSIYKVSGIMREDTKAEIFEENNDGSARPRLLEAAANEKN